MDEDGSSATWKRNESRRAAGIKTHAACGGNPLVHKEYLVDIEPGTFTNRPQRELDACWATELERLPSLLGPPLQRRHVGRLALHQDLAHVQSSLLERLEALHNLLGRLLAEDEVDGPSPSADQLILGTSAKLLSISSELLDRRVDLGGVGGLIELGQASLESLQAL